MLNIINRILYQQLDNIESGNSYITEQEGHKIIDLLNQVNSPRINKYKACQFLNISRATFDNLVAKGELPKGIKEAGSNNLVWRKYDLQKYITNRRN